MFNTQSKRRYLKIIALVSVIVFIGFVLLSAAIAFAEDEGSSQEETQQNLQDSSQIKLFIKIIEYIQKYYIKEVSLNDLIKGAIRGMINSLDDPYSNYFDRQSYDEFKLNTSGTYGGIGVVIGMRDGFVTVVSPIEGGPGEKAGLQPGDKIIKVDGKDITDKNTSEAAQLIRGEKGTQVQISVVREGESHVLNFVITRDIIELNPIEHKIIDENIGYIKISSFNDNTEEYLEKALKEFKDKKVKGIVLDLRGNPGGILGQAVKVAGKFMPPGPVVKIQNRDGEEKTYSSEGNYYSFPMVVLVNGGSASASEIVAGALQDHGVATIVGTQTYGKATVQTTANLGSLGGFKLTIANYLTPKGRDINEKGITPDVVVEPAPKGPSHEEFAPLGKERLITKGTIGLDVYGIQQRLAYLGFDPGSVDGIYGRKTARAVANFQQAKGLPIVGIVNAETYAALKKAVSEKESKENSIDVQLNKAIEILKQKL